MTMGADVDARAALQSLIDAAAPAPLPPDQALPLLRQVETGDVAELARLAYHALTGVEPPADGEPQPAGEALPGFPPFVAEVLGRAINGPEQRRPTRQALLMVLETVPPTDWPHAGVEAGVQEATHPEEASRETPASPAVGADEDPAEPDAAAVEDELQAGDELDHGAELDHGDELGDEVDDGDEVGDEPDERRDERRHDAHREFRHLVAPPRAVPTFEPLEGAGELPGLGRHIERRRRSGRRGRRRRRSSTGPSAAARRQTLVMVLVLLVLIALGVVYAANRADDQPVDDNLAPQGAPAAGAVAGLG